MSSVRGWAAHCGYEYALCGDDLFDRLPGWYADKTAGRLPIAADLARLLWISEQLQQGAADVVAWLDVDVFIMAPSHFRVAPQSSCIFGYEHWLQESDKKPFFKIRRNVHNAYCAFRRDCAILPFLIEAVQRMVRRVDPAFLAPQFVGPKLLTSLHNIVGFETDPALGAISPLLAKALLAEFDGTATPADQRMLAQFRAACPVPLLGANLCASLLNSKESDTNVPADRLLDVLAPLKNGLK